MTSLRLGPVRREKLRSTFREAFGDRFVDYIVHIKRAEIARFLSNVTDWEHREYFEMF